MATNSSRVRKIGDQIQRDLSAIIAREMKDPRVGMVTLNEVRVSSDLSYADVYFTCMAFGEQPEQPDVAAIQQEQTELLNKAAGFMRSQLAQGLKLRVIPQLRFHYDGTLEQGSRVSSLIDRAVASDRREEQDED